MSYVGDVSQLENGPVPRFNFQDRGHHEAGLAVWGRFKMATEFEVKSFLISFSKNFLRVLISYRIRFEV
jgi:hypothetical protein